MEPFRDIFKDLSHLARRKVSMNDEEDLSNDLPQAMAQFAGGGNMVGNGNQPIEDMNNGGVSPFSLDARANQVVPPPPPPQEQDAFGSLAGYLKNLQSPGLTSNISDYVSNSPLAEETRTIGRVAKGAYDNAPDIMNKLAMLAGGGLAGVSRGGKPSEAQQKEVTEPFHKWLNSAAPSNPISPQDLGDQEASPVPSQEQKFSSPEMYQPYTEQDSLINSPEVKMAYEQYTGEPLTPDVQEQISKYKKVMDDMDKGLSGIETQYDEQMAGLKQRIDSNSATEMDKYLIGAALLMPAIVGAAFGKDAGIGALGGALTGLGKGMQQRSEGVSKDRERLGELTTQKGKFGIQRGELEIERAKIPAEIKKQMKGSDHLQGKNMVSWTDPETGQKQSGIEIMPNLIAPMSMLGDKEDLKDIRKNANDISDQLALTDKISSIGNDISELMDAVDKQSPGTVKKLLQAMAYKNKRVRIAMTGSVDPVKFRGKMVNPIVLTEQMVGKAQDAYLKAMNIRRTEGGAQHAEDVLVNYFNSGASAKDVQDATLNVIELLQHDALTDAESKGFYADPILNHFKKSKSKILGTLDKGGQRREEEEIVKGLK